MLLKTLPRLEALLSAEFRVQPKERDVVPRLGPDRGPLRSRPGLVHFEPGTTWNHLARSDDPCGQILRLTIIRYLGQNVWSGLWQ